MTTCAISFLKFSDYKSKHNNYFVHSKTKTAKIYITHNAEQLMEDWRA